MSEILKENQTIYMRRLIDVYKQISGGLLIIFPPLPPILSYEARGSAWSYFLRDYLVE